MIIEHKILLHKIQNYSSVIPDISDKGLLNSRNLG